ncbi:hypothetical protein BDW74DRAFT_173436 [Aspergillus multicolor]|uniref:uncharacterized protein n=1 Tax=Aspergillus multicolor TaxID=41759 RepID=UPI003CCD4C95
MASAESNSEYPHVKGKPFTIYIDEDALEPSETPSPEGETERDWCDIVEEFCAIAISVNMLSSAIGLTLIIYGYARIVVCCELVVAVAELVPADGTVGGWGFGGWEVRWRRY